MATMPRYPAVEFCQPIADIICERVAHGDDLATICADGDMPSLTIVYKWLHSTPAFADAYGHAGKIRADGLAYKAQAISERTHVTLPNGMFVAADPQRDRLIVDTLKWRASKMNPKIWGDKLAVEHSGSITFSELADEELLAEVLELVTSGKLALPDGARIVFDQEPDDFDHNEFA